LLLLPLPFRAIKTALLFVFFFLHKNFETLAFIYLFIIIFCLLFLDWFGLDCGSV